MARHRIHSLAFKKQVVQEYAAGATLNALAREHDLSRTLIRIWIAKCESGEFDPDVEAATLLGDYEAKIATLERMVGRQAVEIEFLKGADDEDRRRVGRCTFGAEQWSILAPVACNPLAIGLRHLNSGISSRQRPTLHVLILLAFARRNSCRYH